MLSVNSADQYLHATGNQNALTLSMQRNLIRSYKLCACGEWMHVETSSRYSCGYAFRCRVCSNRTSLLTGTVFENSKISISQALQLAMQFISGASASTASGYLKINKNSTTRWYNIFRQVCQSMLTAQQQQQQLGGRGHIVQVDETLMIKRKYHRGRLVREIWVFGMYDVDAKRGIAERVHRRDAATLLPIIQRCVAPGTTIWSDQWAAYSGLQNLGYFHQTVNHSIHFVDPITGCHTNNVEAFWGRIKKRVRKVNGSKGDNIWDHVSEELYRQWFQFKEENVYDNFNMFLEHISLVFPR